MTNTAEQNYCSVQVSAHPCKSGVFIKNGGNENLCKVHENEALFVVSSLEQLLLVDRLSLSIYMLRADIELAIFLPIDPVAN